MSILTNYTTSTLRGPLTLPKDFQPVLSPAPLPPPLECSFSEVPLTQNLKIIELPNGFSIYFLQHAGSNANVFRASINLLIQVGHHVETKEEEGIAHLVEHCVFLGTNRFSYEEIHQQLKDLGCEIGADSNAVTCNNYTNFVLNNLKVESNHVERGLELLYEMAFNANFPKEFILNERNIVNEEFLQKQPETKEELLKLVELFYEKLESRDLQTFLSSELKSFSVDSLKERLHSFYAKWYCPQNMQLVIVGNFGDQQPQQNIINFASTLFSSQPRHLAFQPISKKTFCLRKGVYHYQSFEKKSATVEIFQQAKNEKKYFKKGKGLNSICYNLVMQLFISIFNRRMSEQLGLEASYFSAGMCASKIENYTGNFLTLISKPKPGKIVDVYKRLLEECLRFYYYKVQDTELKQAVTEQALKCRLFLDHQHLVSNELKCNEIVASLCESKLPRDLAAKVEIELELLQKITTEHLLVFTRQWLNFSDDSIAQRFCLTRITAPSSQLADGQSDKLQMVFKQVIMQKVTDFTLKPELAPMLPSLGPICGDFKRERIAGCDVFQLKNGIKVICKPTSDANDEIYLTFINSKVGLRNFSKKDIYNVLYGRNAQSYCGEFGLSNEKFVEFATSKSIFQHLVEIKNTYWSIKVAIENMTGFETALQIINSTLADSTNILASDKFINHFKNQIAQSKDKTVITGQNPGELFKMYLKNAIWGEHPYYRGIAPEDYDDLDEQRAAVLLREIFQTFAEGTLIICGKFDFDNALPLVEGYLGNLAGAQCKSYSIPWKKINMIGKPAFEETYYLSKNGTETFVYIPMPGPESYKEMFNREYFQSLLTSYFNTIIRFKQQKAYSIYVDFIVDALSLGSNYLKFSIGGSSEVCQSFKEDIPSVLNQMFLMDDDELVSLLNTTKAQFGKKRESDLKRGAYISWQITNCVIHNENLESIETMQEMEKAITIQDLKMFIGEILKNWNFRKIIVNNPIANNESNIC